MIGGKATNMALRTKGETAYVALGPPSPLSPLYLLLSITNDLWQPTTDRHIFASENGWPYRLVAACASILTLGRVVIKLPPDPDALPFGSPHLSHHMLFAFDARPERFK